MGENQWIIENINATMAMEDMPLTKEDRQRILDCFEGNKSFEDAIQAIVNKYMQKQEAREFITYENDEEKDAYYCYPGTSVLKNEFEIKDLERLKLAERELTSIRMAQLMSKPLKMEFDFKGLKQIHRFLFQDIYTWAGKTRKVDIAKGNLFCLCQYIDGQMSEIMNRLRRERSLDELDTVELAAKLAYYLGEINAVHPFREGNGRTQRLFIQQLARKAGHQLDYSKITTKEMLEASIQTFHLDYSLMEKIMLQAISDDVK